MAFYISAFFIIAGVALFVAAPLAGGLGLRARRGREELETDRLEHEHALAVQGLRELEFDREMGKLSDADYASLRASLEGRALQAMSSIERSNDQERAVSLAAVTVRPKLREAAAIASEISAMSKPQPAIPIVSGLGGGAPTSSSTRNAPVEIGGGRRIRFCPQCGTRTPLSGNFCGECGTPLRAERAVSRAS